MYGHRTKDAFTVDVTLLRASMRARWLQKNQALQDLCLHGLLHSLDPGHLIRRLEVAKEELVQTGRATFLQQAENQVARKVSDHM